MSQRCENHTYFDQAAQAMGDFTMQSATDHLRWFENKTVDDLEAVQYKSTCMCGCEEGVRMIDYLDYADLDSWKHILSKQYLSGETICHLLARLFSLSGSCGCSNREYKKAKAAGWDASQLSTINPTIDYILDYVVRFHRTTAKNWLHPEYKHSLLQSVFTGHAKDEVIRTWMLTLLRVGLDPFYSHRHANALQLAMWNINVKAIEDIIAHCPDDRQLMRAVNSDIDQNGCNILMWVMVVYRRAKNAQTLQNVIRVIDIILKLGIDLQHTDSNGLNCTDYATAFHFDRLLGQRMIGWPDPTGGHPNDCRRDRELYSDWDDDIPGLTIIRKHFYDKTEDELTQFRREYMAAFPTVKLLNKKLTIPPGGRRDSMHNIGFGDVFVS